MPQPSVDQVHVDQAMKGKKMPDEYTSKIKKIKIKKKKKKKRIWKKRKKNLAEIQVDMVKASQGIFSLRASNERLNHVVRDVPLNSSYRNDGRYRGVRVRPELRLAIYLRDRMRCLYCNTDLLLASRDKMGLVHLVSANASDRVPDNTPSNLITACQSCNSSRKDQPWENFASTEAAELIEQRRHAPLDRLRKLAKSMIEKAVWA